MPNNKRQIWIDLLPGTETIGAFGFEKVLTHLAIESSGPNIEDIFWGRIQGAMGNQAFVDIGRPLPALLNWKKPLPQGHKLFVQVTRQEIIDAFQEKGCKVTTDLTLSGTYVRFKPLGKTVYRSSSQGIPATLITDELARLQNLWRSVQETKAYHAPIPPFKLLLDLSSIDSIQIGHWEVYEQVLKFLKTYRPSLLEVTKFVPSLEKNSLRDASLEALEDLKDSTIALPGGGHGVIQETLACVAIDLNTSSTHLETPQGITIYEEIARQINLRGLGGLIVIDWPATAPKPIIQKEMERALSPFHAKVLGWTRGGLLEVLRPRRGPSLRNMWS